MGSTNKTANYDLPQWIGTDKPTWLGDMNDAFLKIDTGMKQNQTEISGAVSDAGNALNKATAAEQGITTLTPIVNTASENASQALSTANNAQSTATTANGNANSALMKLNDFNWSSPIKLTMPSGVNWDIYNVYCSINTGMKLLNIYGEIEGSWTNTDNLIPNGSTLINLANSIPKPTQTRTLNSAVTCYILLPNIGYSIQNVIFKIFSDGHCTGSVPTTDQAWNAAYFQIMVNMTGWY